MTEDKYLTTEEVAERLRRSPRMIRDWVVKGCPTERGRVHLEATKAGKSWLVHPDWLALFEHESAPFGGRISISSERPLTKGKRR
jgi:hypothetical protein